MKHIEFFGIPGAGKSTLVETTIKCLQQQEKPACTLKNAFFDSLQQQVNVPIPEYLLKYFPDSYVRWYLMKVYRHKGYDYDSYQLFFTEHPELGSIIPRYIAEKSDDVSDRLTYSNWFYKLITRYQISKKMERNWLVIDEGFINRTVTLFSDREECIRISNDLTKYLESIPTPDLVIVPHVPVEVSASRIRAGNRSFPYKISETDHQEQLAYLQERQAHVETVLEILHEQDMNIIYIDNSATKKDAESELRTKLKSSIIKGR